MSEIKNPKWDKPHSNPSAGGYGLDTTIPPNDYIDVGMTAHAKHKSDSVIIKISKVVNKHDTEGIITQIIPKIKKEPKTNLLVGDRVFINRFDIEVLLR